MDQRKPSDEADRIVLRLPDGMRSRIAQTAKRNGRSVNAELVGLLETFYPPAAPVAELVDEIADLLDVLGRDPEQYEFAKELEGRVFMLRDRLNQQQKAKAKK